VIEAFYLVGMCLLLFVAMLLLTLEGHRFGRRRRVAGSEVLQGSATITAAIFGLLSLLIAFTFSGAYARFEHRRELMTEEINDIGTAYLRVDLLPAADQPRVRALFHEYTASRANVYRKLVDPPAARAEMANSVRLQQAIWSAAVAATDPPDERVSRVLVLGALNTMIDITTTIEVALYSHPHPIIFGAMVLLALVCSWLVGYEMSERERPSRVYVLGFAAVTAIVLYVTLDVEFPRVGIVRLDWVNEMLAKSGEAMK
jgi:hypothetical protein